MRITGLDGNSGEHIIPLFCAWFAFVVRYKYNVHCTSAGRGRSPCYKLLQ